MEKSDDRYFKVYLRTITRVKEQKLLIEVLRNELQEERFRNLRMRMDLQALSENPEGKAASRIRHRYNIKRVVLGTTPELTN
jgi:hypothetical protein